MSYEAFDDEPRHQFDEDNQFTVARALSFGWNAFRSNAPIWVALILGCAAVSIAVDLAIRELEVAGTVAVPLWGDDSVSGLVSAVVTLFVTWLLSAVLTQAALVETSGRKARLSDALGLGNLGNVLLASALVTVLYLAGAMLFIVPGIVFLFLSYYTLPFVLDRDQSAVKAIGSSCSLVAANAGRLFLLALAVTGINAVGSLLCLIGLLVTIPMTTIATTFAFRTLQG
ncbi:MAG: hypothetical protein ACRDO7_16225 [Nocardioidaceae bacterium]